MSVVYRVGTLAWSPQSSILASGSRDRRVLLQDVKIKGSFDSAVSSPFYSPGSRASPFSSSRRHSAPTPTYSSRACKIDSVFESSSNFAAISSFASPFGMSSRGGGEEGRPAQDSPPLHEQVFSSGGGGRSSREVSSWSIFDPDDSPDPFMSAPPVLMPGSVRSNKQATLRWRDEDNEDEDALDDKELDENAEGEEEQKETAMDISDDDARDEPSLPPSDPDGIFAGGSLLFSPRAPSPPCVPLHRPVSSCHSTPTRPPSGSGPGRSSYPSSPSPHSTAPCRIRELQAHKQEVCGLKWSFDEKQLASGGNDNKLLVWNVAATGEDSRRCSSASQPIAPEFKFSDHTAAVKAIAWSPHQSGLLASGGACVEYFGVIMSSRWCSPIVDLTVVIINVCGDACAFYICTGRRDRGQNYSLLEHLDRHRAAPRGHGVSSEHLCKNHLSFRDIIVHLSIDCCAF